MTQEEFDVKLENTLNKNKFTWKLIKTIVNKYPEQFDDYAERHKERLVIRTVTPCDGCKWNDGNFHTECYHCCDD